MQMRGALPVPDGDDGQLDKLQRYLKELEAAWAEFEHQARRYGDTRERGTLGIDEVAAGRLRRNMAENETEQARVRAEIARLQAGA